jgi:hypothetical protein
MISMNFILHTIPEKLLFMNRDTSMFGIQIIVAVESLMSQLIGWNYLGVLMKWIKVSDQMPETQTDVLTYCISHGITKEGFINTYRKNEEYMAIDQIVKWRDMEPSFRCDRCFGKVIAWMPLPDKPE